MKKEQFIDFVKAPHQLNDESSTEIKKLVDDFPYCQLAQVLYAKNLHDIDSVNYNTQLKIASAYSSDREQLYRLIMREPLGRTISNIEEVIANEIPDAIKIEVEEEVKEISKDENITEVEKDILTEAISASITLEADAYSEANIEKKKVIKELPITGKVAKKELRSFNDWLKHFPQNKESINVEKSKTDLIDNFLGDDNKDAEKKTEFFSPVNIARLSVIEDESFVTETLAKIYIGQGSYSKAVKAFKQLMVRNPSKSSYFASQIEKIENLKDK